MLLIKRICKNCWDTERRTGRPTSGAFPLRAGISASRGDLILLVCHGSWPGVITREPAGTGGFGYDPIFFVPSEVAAELTREEKSAISHRGQALKLLLDALRNG